MAELRANLIISARNQAGRALSSLKGQLSAATQQASLAQRAMNFAGQTSLAANAMQQLGSQMDRATSGPIKAFADFDQQMRRVKALTGDLTSDEFTQMTEVAERAGEETFFTSLEAARGLEQLAIAGFDAKQQMVALMPTLRLAQAGQVDLGRAADIASDLMGGFGKTAKDIPQIADTLVAGFTNSTTTLETLFQTLKLVGPVTKDFGIPMKDAVKFAGLLGSAGLKGSIGGTALRVMLSRLAEQTPNAADALRSVGIQAGELQSMADDPVRAMKTLGDAFDKFGKEGPERSAILMQVFGQEAATAVSVMMENANKIGKDGLTGFQRMEQGMSDLDGLSERLGKTMEAGPVGEMKKMEAQMDSLQREIGKAMMPAQLELLQVQKELASEFSSLIKDNPDLIKAFGKAALILGKVLGVAAPLLLTISAVSSTVGILSGAFRFLIAPTVAATTSLGGASASAGGATASMGLLSKTVTATKLAMQGFFKVTSAAAAGWAFGRIVDNAVGSLLDLRGELVSTELALQAAESDTFNEVALAAGDTLGIETLERAARQNMLINRNRQRTNRRGLGPQLTGPPTEEVVDLPGARGEAGARERGLRSPQIDGPGPRGEAGARERGLRSPQIDGLIKIELDDRRAKVTEVTKTPDSPDFEVGTN